ncbi:MAG: phage portal protein [Nocardioides sp.]
MTTWTPQKLAVSLLAIIDNDADRMDLIDDYGNGDHRDPYMPEKADAEYKLLAERCVTNVMPIAENTPAQTIYLDGYRPGVAREGDETPEWDHFQRSRMDARQSALYRGAFRFGHSFTETYRPKGGGPSQTRGISARNAAALFEDPANDIVPFAALEIKSRPKGPGDERVPGRAVLWTGKDRHDVTFLKMSDSKSVKVGVGVRHGASTCPIRRFACAVDLEGRTVGLVEPLIPLQDRINQTIFDLLIAQTYGSFKVRTVTGMAPPLQMQPERDEDGKPTGDWEPVIDERTGQPRPADINLNAKRFLYAEDEGVKFGTLDETPLAGYIESIELAFRQFTALSQTPPHFMLGQIANLSAEALQAAETSLARKVEEFRKGFGESWESVFQLAAELDGNADAAAEFKGEVLWRDMDSRSMSKTADALGKLHDIGVPTRALIRLIPGVTNTTLREWEEMLDDDPQAALSAAATRSTAGLASLTRGGE